MLLNKCLPAVAIAATVINLQRRVAKNALDVLRAKSQKERQTQETIYLVEKTLQKLQEAEEADNNGDQFRALTELIRSFEAMDNATKQIIARDCGISPAQIRDKVNILLSIWYGKLATDLSSAKGLLKFMSFLELIRFETTGSNWIRGFDVPRPPDSWDDRVALYIRNPGVSDFQRSKDLAPGEGRLRAIQALDVADLTDAKFILALCNSNPVVRAELNEDLVNRLARYSYNQFKQLGNAIEEKADDEK